MARRLPALGGIAGPVAFIAAWAVLGARTKGYNPTVDPISRLAAVGAPTRAEMTAGLLAFAAGATSYSVSAREQLSPRVAGFTLANVACTLGVAALPLEGFGGSAGHAAAAATAYLSLAAMPAAGAAPLAAAGYPKAAVASRVAAAAILGALLVSISGTSRTGFFQRLGLTLGDAWIIASSVWMLRRAAPRPPRTAATSGR